MEADDKRWPDESFVWKREQAKVVFINLPGTTLLCHCRSTARGSSFTDTMPAIVTSG